MALGDHAHRARAAGDHTEAMRVTFDPSVVTYTQLLRKFWSEHKPMPKAFTGTQYRSAVWPHNDQQRADVERVRSELVGDSPFASLIGNTAIEPAETMYRGEEYHQRYLMGGRVTSRNNLYDGAAIAPAA